MQASVYKSLWGENLFVYRRGLDIQSTSFLYAYFRDGTYLEYRKQTILGWDSLLGKKDFLGKSSTRSTFFKTIWSLA